MIVRDWNGEDLSNLTTAEAPKFDECVSIKVVEDGKIGLALCARPTVELFMLFDRNWKTPLWRWEALKLGHEAMRRKLADLNFTDAHVWLPPHIEKSFGERKLMARLGWKKQMWPCFMREV